MEMDAAEYSYGDVQIEQDLADQMPQLEANTFQQHSSASSASVPITISASKLTAPFAFSYPNEAATLLKQERMMASMDRKPTSITTASKGVKKEGGVLGAIWDELDGDTRALIAATRDNKPLTSEVLGKKEKEACSSSVLSFDGNPNNAPAYFNELCIKLGQYAYQSDNAIRIMFATMKGVARTWITGTVASLGDVDNEMKVPMILGKFREHYLTASQAAMWRKQLTSMKLTSSSDRYISLNDLEIHYASFVKVLNNLRMCDVDMRPRDAIAFYLESLPQFIYQYLGDSHKTKTTLEELHRAATGALRSSDHAAPKKQQPKGVIEVNVNEVRRHQRSSESEENGQAVELYDAQLKKKLLCFHCGVRGHTLTECRIYKSNQAQTPGGKAAFAQFQQIKGTNYEYDPLRLVQSAKKWKNFKQPQQQSSSSTSTAVVPTVTGGRRRLRKIQDTSNASEGEEAEAIDSVEIIDTWKDGDDDDVAEGEGEQTISVSSINVTDHSSSSDAKAHTSLCVSATINGKPAGHALIDQGANRALIRRSALRKFGLEQVV
jgi:hypothetical protein